MIFHCHVSFRGAYSNHFFQDLPIESIGPPCNKNPTNQPSPPPKVPGTLCGGSNVLSALGGVALRETALRGVPGPTAGCSVSGPCQPKLVQLRFGTHFLLHDGWKCKEFRFWEARFMVGKVETTAFWRFFFGFFSYFPHDVRSSFFLSTCSCQKKHFWVIFPPILGVGPLTP